MKKKIHVSLLTLSFLASLTLRWLTSYTASEPAGERPQAARLLRSWVRIPPGAWIFVCCECRVLSGRGLCDELITRPEEFYRLCCVAVCDLETSRICAPYIYIYIYDISSLRVNICRRNTYCRCPSTWYVCLPMPNVLRSGRYVYREQEEDLNGKPGQLNKRNVDKLITQQGKFNVMQINLHILLMIFLIELCVCCR